MDQLFEPPEPEPSGIPEDAPNAPLAARMRPRTLGEVVGQQHVLGEGSGLRTAIEQGQPHSMILHGPPGTGKTTIARLTAAESDFAFEELSAVQAGRAEVREVMARAGERRRGGRGTVFFLDEIHRFNKAQQDALLPAVEDGTVVLIGATTENPYFEVNSALISRTRLYELRALTDDDVVDLLRRGLETLRGAVDEGVPEFVAQRSGGDARTALNALEVAWETAGRDGRSSATLEDAEDALQKRAVLYDRAGDKHYDYISAWIKSTRGSDVDASLYYLAVMLEGGEDARFIARRMVILASEDIGNADPRALQVAVAAAQAAELVGLPEAHYPLAQAATYLALAPKSNAAGKALHAARTYVREHGAAIPPTQMQTAAYAAARKLGRGIGYRFPHDEPGHVNDQTHLPDGVEGQVEFYVPDDTEQGMAERFTTAKRGRGRV